MLLFLSTQYLQKQKTTISTLSNHQVPTTSTYGNDLHHVRGCVAHFINGQRQFCRRWNEFHFGQFFLRVRDLVKIFQISFYMYLKKQDKTIGQTMKLNSPGPVSLVLLSVSLVLLSIVPPLAFSFRLPTLLSSPLCEFDIERRKHNENIALIVFDRNFVGK